MIWGGRERREGENGVDAVEDFRRDEEDVLAGRMIVVESGVEVDKEIDVGMRFRQH